MNVATNYLREHLNFTYRMHYIILEGGEAPNVVPDKATVWYFLRNSDQRLKAMATSAIDLLTKPDALKDIRKEFADYAKTHPYKSFLPADAKPPLDINEKLMNQYRPLMEAFYPE